MNGNCSSEFSIENTRAAKNTVALELGLMGTSFDALHKCTDDLVASWGLNAAEQKTLLHPPIPKTNPAKWLLSSDYPGVAAEMGLSFDDAC